MRREKVSLLQSSQSSANTHVNPPIAIARANALTPRFGLPVDSSEDVALAADVVPFVAVVAGDTEVVTLAREVVVALVVIDTVAGASEMLTFFVVVAVLPAGADFLLLQFPLGTLVRVLERGSVTWTLLWQQRLRY